MSEALKARQHVGKSYKKVDAATILSGRAAYTEDFVPPHALVIKVLRSPHPMAKILDINATAALKLPGVEAVFTIKMCRRRGSLWQANPIRNHPPMIP